MTAAPAATVPARRLSFEADAPRPSTDLEWLVANGLGGYASGLVGGGLSRRYHGLLVAALPAPLGRMLYLTHLRIAVRSAGRISRVDHESLSVLDAPDAARLAEFRLEHGLPVWTYRTGSTSVLEKRIVMPHGQNTVHVILRHQGATQATLRLEPLMHVRPHEGAVSTPHTGPPSFAVNGHAVEVTLAGGLPGARWLVTGGDVRFELDTPAETTVEYAMERARGYDFEGQLWTPGAIEITADADAPVAFVASTEHWDQLEAASSRVLEKETERRSHLLACAGAAAGSIAGDLALAADQFLVTPAGRAPEVALARAAGEEARSVMAGYHWFTDWGRDTMISLEGLTLETGRPAEASRILQTFARHLRDGLIPNLFPEGERTGLYHTADATLWFVHALDRYVTRTGDPSILTDLKPTLIEIVECHLAGTHFGIRIDPGDGLLTQGAEHVQLTWMDAKVGDWVVTPRRGKAVEINALWYNALVVIAGWLHTLGDDGTSDRYRRLARQARRSFNRRFWRSAAEGLFDVIDGPSGDDGACRPNQIFAVSLPRPVLARRRWPAVVALVERELLTPVGLRSLARGDPGYQPKYFGDLHARDAAYHQGTVWAWLIGPFIDAWLKVHPGRLSQAHRLLAGFVPHLDNACVGSVSEIFDAEPPFRPRGCISQAWSVAELLRAWRRTDVV